MSFSNFTASSTDPVFLTPEEEEPAPATITSNTISFPTATAGKIIFNSLGASTTGKMVITGNGGNGGNWISVPLGNWGAFPTASIPVSTDSSKPTIIKDDRDGCDCKTCKNFFQFAEPNQADGSMICWSCRNGY